MILDSEAPNPHRLSHNLSCPALFQLSFILVLFFVSPLLNSPHARVLAQEEAQVSPDDVLRVRTDLVTVPALVTDSHGRRVPGLTQSDFSLRDNGSAVELSYFAAGTEHVALCFALDSSGSIREVIARQHDAALKLFSRFGKGSRVAVQHFGERAEMVVPFTTDAARVQPAFDSNPSLSRRTAIFDAAAAAIRTFAMERSVTGERRILILISDGLDTASAVRASAVITEARAQNVSIYVIHLPLYEPRDGRLSVRPASKGFRELAEKTGGRYFLISDRNSALDPNATPDLAPVFQAIEEDLQGQYVLGYYPHDADRAAGLHRIEISLSQRVNRKLRVRALREEYNLKQ
jgi:Ca-activated chloride channel family protein